MRPVEGYGATELSPVVAGNCPPSRAVSPGPGRHQGGHIGRPLPSIIVKIVDLESGGFGPQSQRACFWVSGPGVMKGYYGRPELTAEVLRDGWYVTGDVATIDEEGFIRITGRISRFSKLAGEMVPHVRVEEAIREILGYEEDELKVAVMAVPDPKKGERLVVLYTELGQRPEQICREFAGRLPPLWVPSPDSFCQVEAIPVLGTGKLDLSRLKELALAEVAG